VAEDFNADVIEQQRKRISRSQNSLGTSEKVLRNSKENRPEGSPLQEKTQKRIKQLRKTISEQKKTLKAIRAESRPVRLDKSGYSVIKPSTVYHGFHDDNALLNEMRGKSKTLNQMSDAEFDKFKKDLDKPRKRGGSGGAVTKSPTARIGGGPRRHKTIQETLADIIN